MSYSRVFEKDSIFERKCYYKDKEHRILHREDGPAYEWKSGTKKWYINNHLHREDGPAVESSNGEKRYYLNGKRFFSEENYWQEIARRRFGDFV